MLIGNVMRVDRQFSTINENTWLFIGYGLGCPRMIVERVSCDEYLVYITEELAHVNKNTIRPVHVYDLRVCIELPNTDEPEGCHLRAIALPFDDILETEDLNDREVFEFYSTDTIALIQASDYATRLTDTTRKTIAVDRTDAWSSYDVKALFPECRVISPVRVAPRPRAGEGAPIFARDVTNADHVQPNSWADELSFIVRHYALLPAVRPLLLASPSSGGHRVQLDRQTIIPEPRSYVDRIPREHGLGDEWIRSFIRRAGSSRP